LFFRLPPGWSSTTTLAFLVTFEPADRYVD
jgi:hypothetical protein